MPENTVNALFKVSDITGRIIQQFTLNGEINRLNLSEYSAGVYLLNIEHEGASHIIRLV